MLEVGAGTLSNVESFKLLKVNVPQLKTSSAKFLTGIKEIFASPKQWFDGIKQKPIKVTVQNIGKTAVQTLLDLFDVRNIEDDI